MRWSSARSVRRGTPWPSDVHVHGGGEVRVGERVVFDTSIAPIELHVEVGATIAIGDDVYVASGTSMEAQRSICIGARACIGAFTKIIDGHFHVLEGDRHVRPAPSAVIVEDDVTIGPRCVLLPRAHVGRGSRRLLRRAARSDGDRKSGHCAADPRGRGDARARVTRQISG